MRVGYIENAHDPYHDEASLEEGRENLRRAGYTFDLVDLRGWRRDRAGLAQLLGTFDAFLLAGGNPYHLRSLMHHTGANTIITARVREGVVYARSERGRRRRRADPPALRRARRPRRGGDTDPGGPRPHHDRGRAARRPGVRRGLSRAEGTCASVTGTPSSA